ncbi:ribonucleotide-diphosphate reductase subunit beta, partial [Enterobacter cloacae complex sp. 4DZ1-17B1]|uniref:ribonucleotide-diphosphate reductase subunit beta n=1 Tax=Enterobacter cloacae complex sp. 4DZ1-17B1 TaxID=2511991 RepID=UPI001026A617
VYSYFDKAVELETAYAKDVLPRGILGLNSSMFMSYIQFIANRRLAAIGLKDKYPSKVNPFPWLSEAMDLGTCGNFFETKIQEYKTGAMEDDF